MRTDPKEMLAVGIFGAESRLGARVERLLQTGRAFTSRASASTVIASATALGGLLIAGALMPRWIAFAQDSHPVFEAVSIKPAKCDQNPFGRPPSPDRVSLPCRTLRDVLDLAYGRPLKGLVPDRDQVVGGPAWIDTETWDIEAKASGAHRQSEMNGPMMQAVLEDRFRLRIHRETRSIPTYELAVAKGGPKLQATKPGSCTVLDPEKPPPQGLERPCGGNWGINGGVEMWGMTMKDLCGFLSARMDRDVIDKTGIVGMFDLVLKIAPSAAAPAAEPASEPGNAVFQGQLSILKALARDEQRSSDGAIGAAVEQVGLKVVSAKGPAEFIVIDHIERPSEN